MSGTTFGDIEIAGDKARGEPERTRGLHHQHGEIAAAAALHPQCLDRVLNPALLARDIT